MDVFYIYIISIAIITLLIHFIIYALTNFYRKKKQENVMIENAALILNKLDNMKKSPGGKKMEKDIKILARYLKEEIKIAKKEILEEMEAGFTAIEEYIAEAQEETEEPEEEREIVNEFSEIEDEDEETEEPEEEKEIPEALDISKRQVDIPKEKETKDKKVKKKGFLGMGGKK